MSRGSTRHPSNFLAGYYKTMKQNQYDRVKKWRKENREKHQEQWLRYYQLHKDRIKAERVERYHLRKQGETDKETI